MSMSMTVSGITKTFAGVKALECVSLQLGLGSIHALVGENGAGKSTLLRIMAGIMRPDAGDVALEGAPVYESPRIKQRIAFVPTQCSLFSGYRQGELLKLYQGMYPNFSADKYRQCVAGLEFGSKPVRKLSTGMQLLVSVALALAAGPDALLLDEPFAGLDVIARHRLIQTLIEESGSRDMMILVSSHNVNELEKLCDRATFLTRGRIAQSGELSSVKRAAVRRLQVAFEGEPPADLADWAGITHLETIGRVCYLTVRGDCLDIEARLRAQGVIMLEELGISLEEAFLYSYEQGGEIQ